MRSERSLASARRLAGVTDPSWSPPSAPEDLIDLRVTTFEWGRTDWPAWVIGTGGYEIGSPWRLTHAAYIVVPEHCAYPTLAPKGEKSGHDTYAVEAGTVLTLTAFNDPWDDERVHELDPGSYYAYAEGWATRTYRIEDGQCAGVQVWFSADPRGNRFPFSSRLAHEAIVPALAD